MCVRQGRSVFKKNYCPACIPLSQKDSYSGICVGVAICPKTKKRSIVPHCPQCIKWYEVGVYKRDCPHTPYCKKPMAKINCPPCLTPDEVKVYKIQCPNTSLCDRKRRSTNGSKSCPPCIPLDKSKDCVCNKKTKQGLFSFHTSWRNEAYFQKSA